MRHFRLGKPVLNSRLAPLIVIATLCLATPARAVPVIADLGNHNLLPNTPSQKIPIYISGIAPNSASFPFMIENNVWGMELNVAINDGGPTWGSGGVGPTITNIDVDSGPTIWVAPNSLAGHGPPSEYYGGQLAYSHVATASGFVNVAGGLLATLVVDTTGFVSGTYKLSLGGVPQRGVLPETALVGLFLGGTSGDLSYSGPAGQITIVPEPSSVVLGAIGLTGLVAWGWRRRNR